MEQYKKIRCSSLDRVIRCPASLLMVPLVADRNDQSSANLGTRLHYEIARRAIEEIGAKCIHSPCPEAQEIPQDQKWVVRYCIKRLASVDADSAMEVESAFAYYMGGRFLLSGRIDAFAITPEETEAHAFDWKTGRNPVEPAESNWQVMGYVVLLKRAFPSLRRITFEIVQPWNVESDGFQKVSTTVYEGEELERAEATLVEHVEAALENISEISSGLAQCRWCPVGVQCPVIQKEIKNMMDTLTPEKMAKIKAQADDALLGDMILAARVIKPALEEAELLVHERLDANDEIKAGDGTVITRKMERGSYSVKNPAAVYAELKGMLTDEHLAPALGYPVAKIKEAIACAMQIPRGGKGPVTADSVFATKLEPHFEQGTRKKLMFKKQ